VIQVRTTSEGTRQNQEPVCYGNGIVDIPSATISRCSDKFEMVMNPNLSLAYILSTKLPIQYNRFPSSARKWVLAMHKADSDLSRHLATDIARRMLVEAIRLLGFRLQRKNPPAFLVTHDVETEEGLRRAGSLKRVEEEFNIHSTWFLPSDEYPIDRDIAKELASGGTIGSHDLKHDGKLIHIRRRAELIERMTQSRLRLEQITGADIRCFRAPLLQSSIRILSVLHEAGYALDFSIPCWEPVYPLTMSGFGIESSQAFEINGVVEIPLTLFQDHQVLNVLGMSTAEAIRLWTNQAALIRSFDGDIVLLVHPDYSFSRDLPRYRHLLESLLEIASDEALQTADETTGFARLNRTS